MNDASSKPYTVSDLVIAVQNYQHARGIWSEADQMVAAKKKEMDSFATEEARLRIEADKFAAIVKKIAGNLEK